MKDLAFLLSGAVIITLSGCAGMKAAPPTETPINADEFVISAPVSLFNEQSSELLKGFEPKSFRYVRGKSPIRNFFSVSFEEHNAALITDICRGDLHDSGSTYKSCVSYESVVSVENSGSLYQIKIKPVKKRMVQGRNAMFLPIDMPETDIGKWYEYVSNQTVYFDLEYEAKYPVEALKANFDRKLDEYRWGRGESDAASKQFTNSYSMQLKNNASAIIGARFYPYQDGSLVQIRVKASAASNAGEKSLDWNAIVQEITEKTEGTVNG